MDLPVDHAGDQPVTAEILPLAGGGGRALADLGNLAAADRDKAVLDDAVRKNHVAADDEIIFAHGACP